MVKRVLVENVLRWVPDHACENLFRFVAKVPRKKPESAVARPGKEQDLTCVQHGRVHWKHFGEVRKQSPNTFDLGQVDVEREIGDGKQSGVWANPAVHVKDNCLRAPRSERCQRHASTLIFPRTPTVDSDPRSPSTLNDPPLVQIPAYAVETRVLARRIIDLENYDLRTPVPIKIGNRNPGPLVEPGKPIDGDPIRPGVDIPVRRELHAHTIKTFIRQSGMICMKIVNMKHH